MSLQGSLRTLTIPDLLSLLHQHKKTGLLSLVSRQDERVILLHRGNLVYATACDATRRLGHFLVKMGLVSEEVLTACSRGMEPAFLGQELVARGAIQEKDLHAAIREQVLDVLYEALLWEDGAFHFDEWEAEVPLPSGPVIATPSILLDAIHRFDEIQLVRASFPDLSVVLEVERNDRPEPDPQDPLEEYLSLVDGQRTVVRILRESRRSLYETAQALTALWRQGRLRAGRIPPRVEGIASLPEPWAMPVSPDLPGRIYWVFRQDSKQLVQIARTIAREPTLAAKLLRHVTTSWREPVAGELSIHRIVERLGDLRTHALVLPEVIRGVFFSEREFYWKDCREHSLVCAHLCRDLAIRVHYPAPEEAYLAGLLHKVGVFILIGAHQERYRAVLEEARRTRRDLRLLERREFGTTHDEIGAQYAQRWNFPRSILQAIRFHHQGGVGEGDTLLNIVSIATWIASANVVGVDFFCPAGGRVEDALRRTKLKKKSVLAMSQDTARAALNIR